MNQNCMFQRMIKRQKVFCDISFHVFLMTGLILRLFIYFAYFLGTSDEYDDLEFECSSQETYFSDTDDSINEESIELVPDKDDQSERVSFLAALFKKTFTEVKTKRVKPTEPKEDGLFNYHNSFSPTV